MSTAAPIGRGLLGRARHALVCALVAGVAPAWADGTAGAESADAVAAGAEPRAAESCANLARSPWPRTLADRRTLLTRLNRASERCKAHAPFLAALGGLWLEDSDPAQALLWLERSLLLDPDQLGARADYALALAATGEPTARDDLIRDWRGRADVPPLLMSRLTGMPAPGDAAAPSAGANGATAANGRTGQWAQVREASILFGYESNLDQSPRLRELEITSGGDIITLPLEQQLKPRPGAAAVVDAAWQVAYGPSVGTVLQAGVQVTGRSAPGESRTDWHNLQLAFGASRRLGDWRAQVQTAFSWYGGPLGEPYRLHRVGLSVDTSALGCSHRLGIDIEQRAQSLTPLNNLQVRGAQVNLMCGLPWARDWLVGTALRHSEHRPDDPTRPGGLQRQNTVGLRLLGTVGDTWTLDTSLRLSISKDSEGYSDLLDNNARRELRPIQLSIDLSSPARAQWLQGAETLWQFIALKQRSNLALFRYSSIGLFGGLRWKW